LLATLVQGKFVMNSELKKLYEMIEESKVAMMTTRRRDGHLRSRAMANQKQAGGADLWFVTLEGAGKLEEIEHDPHVNLSYFRESKMEWVSIFAASRPQWRPRRHRVLSAKPGEMARRVDFLRGPRSCRGSRGLRT
jgi:hypothetical protein